MIPVGTKALSYSCGYRDLVREHEVTSPVPDLLRTCYAPTPSEVILTRQYISGAQYGIEELDREILMLQKKRQALQKHIKEHQAILSPIRRLPVEVLGDIFMLCLDNCWQNRIFSAQEAPLLLTQICTSWRDIALSMPRLWSTISLYLPESGLKAEAELVKAWLSRSGNCPLSIRVVDLGQRETHPVIDMILSCSERWQRVEFCLSERCFEGFVPKLSSLLSVSLLTVQSGLHPLYNFLSAHQLRRLHLGHGLSAQNLMVPWDQLTHLHLNFIAVDVCLEILQRSPQLVYCELDELYRNDISPTSQISLKLLISLRITFSTNVNDLLDKLSLPSLRIMELRQLPRLFGSANHTPSTLLLSVNSLFRQSGCPLKRLILQFEKPYIDEHIIDCLQSVPSLIELDLRGYKYSSLGKSAMMRLTNGVLVERRSVLLAPCLQVLKLQYRDGHNFDEEAFLGMIESRWLGGRGMPAVLDSAPVRIVTVCVSFFHHELGLRLDSLKRLRTFRDKGLNIVMTDERSNLSLL